MSWEDYNTQLIINSNFLAPYTSISLSSLTPRDPNIAIVDYNSLLSLNFDGKEPRDIQSTFTWIPLCFDDKAYRTDTLLPNDVRLISLHELDRDL